MPLGYNNDDGAQALDQQQELDFRRGWQVVDAASGSNLVTDGTGTYEVDVAAGDINTPTGTVTCSAATLDLESLVDPDLPRIVTVYRDASGVAQTLAGTPAAKQPTGETAPGPIYQPAPDAFSTTDGVVLATVLLEAAAASVGSGQIRDRRMPASINVDSAEVGSLSAVDFDIGGSDFVSTGTILPLETVSDDLTLNKSNTSYERVKQGSFSEPRVDFAQGQVAVRLVCRMRTDTPGETVFARLGLTTDSYPSTEISVTGTGPTTADSGWVAVEPEFDFPNRLDLETRVSGGSANFTWQFAAIGVQF